MFKRSKGKSIFNFNSAFVAIVVILSFFSIAANSKNYFRNSLEQSVNDSPPASQKNRRINLRRNVLDTPPIKKTMPSDTLLRPTLSDTTVTATDSSGRRNDSAVFVIDTTLLKLSKDTLTAPVAYHADDSAVVDVPGEKMYLYGKISSIKYEDNDLSAPEIQYDQKTNLVKAFLKKDTAGNVVSFVSYKQGDFISVMDSITLNMTTQRGITKGTYTQQGEMYVYGEKIKKVNDDIFYAFNARFTTCNLDTPHFAFVSKRIKFINKKWAFSGPVHPEFEGVPVPIILPFGIFPLAQGKHSGILSPEFTANNAYGLGLENFGYYKILSDYWDATARASVYSYGGWQANLSPRYFKRYRYQGNLMLSFLSTKQLDAKADKTAKIFWSHSMDNKARPGVSFRANVNAGSTQFNNLLPNSPLQNFDNNLSSTVAYQKSWKDKPINLSLIASHSQSAISRIIDVTLPEAVFNLNTQYPFRKKERVGEIKWYENIGVGLTTNAKATTRFFDTAAIFNQAGENLQYGFNHSVPISLSLPPVGVLQIAPSVSYQEAWYQKKISLAYNPLKRGVDTVTTNGFFTARDMSFGIGVSTRIFGLFSFRKNSNVKAIRHEIRPTISATYKPDFTGKATKVIQIDSTGRTQAYNIYSTNVIASAFSAGRFGGLSFSIDNNLSMKVKDKKDTSAEATKKISLIDGFSISGGYNFLQDSFRLSPLSVRAFTTLFEKISITAGGTLDPYKYNRQGFRLDRLMLLDNPLKLGFLNDLNLQLQSSFRGGDDKKGLTATDNNNVPPDGYDPNVPLDEYQQEAQYIRNNPGEFADFSIPWTIDFGYSFTLNRFRIANGNVTTQSSQNVNFNASVNLTPKWKLGGTGNYSISAKELGLLSMYLSRDLHCWQMNINVSPVGRYRSFNISISPKSPILRDLKVNRTRSFTNF